MATQTAMAGMVADADRRLEAATRQLAERSGITPPSSPAPVRDAEMRRVRHRLWLAATLEAVLLATSTPEE